MFKKSSKRNLRQRKEDSEDENDEKLVSLAGGKKANGGSLGSLKTARKKKEKEKIQAKPEKSSLLSFGQEEDGEDESEVFQLKKSSRSRRIAKHFKKLAQEEKEKSETQDGQYSKEYLAELKKSSVAPQSLNSTGYSSKLGADEENEEKYETNSINGGFVELRPGEIPDANRIHAARKQREMMRKYGGDYIPVENTESVKKPPASTSRLVREDEMASTSEEDEGPTFAMKGIVDDGARVAKEIGTLGEGSLHRDEEFDLWEAEMIKKGTSTQLPSKWANEEDNNDPSKYQYSNESTYTMNGGYGTSLPSNGMSTTGVSKKGMSSSETVSDVKKRIAGRLECLEQVHRNHKLDAERNTSDVTESESSAVALSDTTSLSKHYTFFQDMRAYVRDLIDCLNEKVIEIEALEKRRHKIWKDRADLFVSRRQQDVADESSDITSSLSATKPQPLATDLKKQTRIREREARRSRRRSARERAGQKEMHIDGLSSDEEETSMDMAKFGAELEKICQFQETLFEDVVEEFHDVHVILSKFREWKEKHSDSYTDAYIGLCVPRLIAPFVRLAMLHWNPLEKESVNFEEMKWYRDLLFYGVSEDSSDQQEPISGDSDNKVLSNLFEKVVLVKLTTLVRDTWDPLSREQSHRLSLLICRLVRTYPCMRSENRRSNELLLALCTRIQRTIDNDIFIPLYPTSALTNTSTGPGAFFERQTWACIKLYENILIFNGLLSQSVLQELAFTCLLNRYIMLSLQTSPITMISVQKCQRISDAIPSEWLKKENIEDLQPHLASFSRYILHTAKHIFAQMSSASDSDRRKARNCMGLLAKLLSQIGAGDLSNQVLTLLGIKTLL